MRADGFGDGDGEGACEDEGEGGGAEVRPPRAVGLSCCRSAATVATASRNWTTTKPGTEIAKAESNERPRRLMRNSRSSCSVVRMPSSFDGDSRER